MTFTHEIKPVFVCYTLNVIEINNKQKPIKSVFHVISMTNILQIYEINRAIHS